MRSTFKTVFYVNASKEKNGVVPIMGRVTINGTIAQFSCKQTIPKALWDAKGNRAKGKSKEAQAVNFALDNIKAQIVKHYQRLSDREACVTAEMVRNAYQGIGTEYETLLRAFDKENAAFAKRVGKDRSKRTYLKYLTGRTYRGLHPRLLPVPAQRGRACAIFRVDILHTIETYRHHGSLQRKDTKKPVCNVPR